MEWWKFTSWRTLFSFKSIVLIETMSWNICWYVPRSSRRLPSSPESRLGDWTLNNENSYIVKVQKIIFTFIYIFNKSSLTFLGGLRGLKTWRVLTLSRDFGESVPDLLRKNLDVLLLLILKPVKMTDLLV